LVEWQISEICINKIKNKIMALNIKPLFRVLIEPVAAETKLRQGFYSDTKEKPQKELLLQLEMALKNIR
jgi:hypothetical protein